VIEVKGTNILNFSFFVNMNFALNVTPQLCEYSRCRTLEIVIVDGTI